MEGYFPISREGRSQHAILDELEWIREDAKLAPVERDQAVTDLIELVGAVDGILQVQADADAALFMRVCGRTLAATEATQLKEGLLKASGGSTSSQGCRNRISPRRWAA